MHQVRLKAIVAVCDDWGIGLQGQLLVHNAADMRRFVELTRGNVVVMGRKTLESLPGGKVLKGRRNIVLTRNPGFVAEDAEVVHSVDELLNVLDGEERTVWVIGGASVYELLLGLCDELEVTHNHVTVPADSFFPALSEDTGWRVAEVVGSGVTDEGVAYDFVRYERVEG